MIVNDVGGLIINGSNYQKIQTNKISATHINGTGATGYQGHFSFKINKSSLLENKANFYISYDYYGETIYTVSSQTADYMLPEKIGERKRFFHSDYNGSHPFEAWWESENEFKIRFVGTWSYQQPQIMYVKVIPGRKMTLIHDGTPYLDLYDLSTIPVLHSRGTNFEGVEYTNVQLSNSNYQLIAETQEGYILTTDTPVSVNTLNNWITNFTIKLNDLVVQTGDLPPSNGKLWLPLNLSNGVTVHYSDIYYKKV